ncbi:MAG: gliding motility-associated C-terminal domain-containing protein [Bacteroidia bacterium]|nr:gliding motility-associated C-terminal domain-containing protein [Bacteroidia bacterium]
MKDNNNIEELIKQKLSNFESEVGANVWDKIDSQLDQIQPANKPGSGSEAIVQSAGTNVTAWVAGIGAAVIGVATIGVLFFGDAKETSEIVADTSEKIAAQTDIQNDVAIIENQTEVLNSSDNFISNESIENSITSPVVEKATINVPATPLVEDANSEEEFDRSEGLVVANEVESQESDVSNETNSGATENEIEELVNELVAKASEVTIQENSENTPVITEEIIEQKIEEQESLNDRTSSLGRIPNVFTPNADGINDNFIFTTENIAELRVNIYTARGELIYVISGNDDWYWNGDLKTGQSAVEGNYYYAIYATGFDGKKHQKKGTLYLTR